MFGKAKKSVVLSKCEWYEQSSQKLYRDHVLVRRTDPPVATGVLPFGLSYPSVTVHSSR